MKTICYKDFETTLAKDSYYRGRWEYFQKALHWLRQAEWKARDVLEVGPYKLPMVPGCVVLDKRTDLEVPNQIKHDMRKLPWPIPTGRFRCVVGLQVWEHCRPDVHLLFEEAVRVAQFGIFSFPFLWDCPEDPEHHMIDLKTVSMWIGDKQWLGCRLARPSGPRPILVVFVRLKTFDKSTLI